MSEHYLEPITRPVLYSATGMIAGEPVAETGTTQVGDCTGIAGVLLAVSGADENTFVGAVPVDVWPELPGVGTLLEAGAIYQWSGIAVLVRQPHSRTEHDPPDVPALFIVYREGGGAMDWIVGEQVQAGTRRAYDGVEYAAIQAHVTQPDWTPPATVGILWSVVPPPVATWTIGVLYHVDDHALYLGNEYRCLQQHTSIQTWHPVATLNVLWAAV